jgi:hypothetical protein
MNLGIYVDTVVDNELLGPISLMLNEGLQSKVLSDASIFYDGIGHNPYPVVCGMFNSTDIWNFDGNLITLSRTTSAKALNTVNNFSLFYYYGWENTKNTIDLLKLAYDDNVNIICRDEEGKKELNRLTGKECVGVSDNFNDILDIISRCKNGRCKNSRNVCRQE